MGGLPIKLSFIFVLFNEEEHKAVIKLDAITCFKERLVTWVRFRENNCFAILIRKNILIQKNSSEVFFLSRALFFSVFQANMKNEARNWRNGSESRMIMRNSQQFWLWDAFRVIWLLFTAALKCSIKNTTKAFTSRSYTNDSQNESLEMFLTILMRKNGKENEDGGRRDSRSELWEKNRLYKWKYSVLHSTHPPRPLLA